MLMYTFLFVMTVFSIVVSIVLAYSIEEDTQEE